MKLARRRYDEHVRWTNFSERSRQWQSVGRHRDFLAAARSALDRVDPAQHLEIVAQLDLAERTLDELDPLRQPGLLVPDVPDPRPEDLKPFLDGWSPYGPEHRSW